MRLKVSVQFFSLAWLRLMKRGVNLCWIRILYFWCSNLSSVCKWHDAISNSFSVISGVRQGGVLSARFWAVYMDDLIIELRKSGMGCNILNYFIACILYADDVCLLAPSRQAMQTLLNVLHGPSEIVQMKLLYSVCVPIITYASDVVIFPHKGTELLHIAVNDAI